MWQTVMGVTDSKTSPKYLKFGHSLRPPFDEGIKEELNFWWILILIAIKLLPFFTLGVPHEEVPGMQTKLHPGFTPGNPANTVRNITFVKVPFSSFMYECNEDVLRTYL